MLWPGSSSSLAPFVFVKCPRAEGGAGESRSGNREAGGGSVAGTAGGPRAAEPLLTVMLGKTSRRVVGAPRQRPGGAWLPRASPGFWLRASTEASRTQVEVSADPEPSP